MTTDTSQTDIPAQVDLPTALASMTDRLGAERERRRIPGISAVAVHDQETIWAGGLGHADVDARTPATPQTVYRVGSITKLFTATMLMQLRDTDRLHLDDPLERYLPEFKIRSRFPDPTPATFRQVVSHTAGLPREAPLDYRETLAFPTIGEILDSLPHTELDTPPLAEYRYSNLGIAIMGHALAVIAGMPYTEFVTEQILRPMGMRNSGFEAPTGPGGSAATGYVIGAEGTPTRPAPNPHRRGLTPCGQLYSSVEDLALFASLQFRDGPGGHQGGGSDGGAQTLGATSLREMRSPLFMQPDWKVGVGVGWHLSRVGDFAAIGHGGGTEGFSAQILLVPDLKVGVAVCANASTDTGPLARQLMGLLAPAMAEARDRRRAMPDSTSAPGWDRFTGTYQKENFADLQITVGTGGLEGRSPQLPGVTIFFAPDEYGRANAFRMTGGPESGQFAIFEDDSPGPAAGVRIGPYRFVRTTGG